MSCRLSHRSAIRVAFENACALKAKYGINEVFDYSIGNPFSSCPLAVTDAMKESANTESKLHGYMQSAGYDDVRAAIAESLNRRFGSNFTQESIIMTAGAACAINIVLQAVLNQDDEVITFLPSYPAYSMFIDNWNAKSIEVDFIISNGKMIPNIDDLKNKISANTRVVIVNTPNNPSGDVYSEETISSICNTLSDAEGKIGHPIYLISDEPYRELNWVNSSEGLSVNSRFENLYKNTIIAYSFSKSASVAGERVGYAAINPSCDDFENLRLALLQSLGDMGYVNASATSQRIAKHCADETADLSIYKQNRDLLKQKLPKFGFTLNNGDGAFYFLLSAQDKTEDELLQALLDEKIIAVAGSEFGCPGYVRLSYCIDPKNVEFSISAFKKAASALNLKMED